MPGPGDVIGSAFVEIRPEVSAFEGMLQQGLSGPMQRTGSMMGKIFTGAAVGLGGIATAAFAAINHTVDLGQAAYEMGEKFGLSGKQASTFIAVGKLVGVSSDQMGIGMRTLSKQLNTTAIDLKSHASAATLNKLPLQELGIASTDASGNLRDMNSVLGDVADRFATMPDGPQKAALATQLFGRAGTDLIPILDQGSKGIAELTAQAAAEGAIMSGPQVDAAHQAYLAHQKLNEAMSGVALTLGSALMPYFAEAANWLSKHLPDAINTLHRRIDTHKQDIEHWAGVIKDVLVKAFSTLRDVVADVFNNFLKPLGQFAIDHKQVFVDLGVAIAGLFVAKKVGSAATGWVGGVLTDLGRVKSFLTGDLAGAVGGVFGGAKGLGGKGGIAGALSMVGVQKVFVVNMPAGGPGGSPGPGPGVGPGGNAIPLAAAAIIFAGQMNTANTLQNGGAVLPGGPFGMSIPGLTSAMPAGGGAFGNLSDLFTTAQTGGMFGGVDTAKAEADLNAAMKNIHDLPGFTSMTVDQMKGIEEAVRDGKITSQADLLDYLRQMGVLNDTISLAVGQANGIPPQLAQYVATSGLANKSGKDFQGGVEALAQQTGESINQIISAYTVTTGFSKDVAAESDKDFRKVRDLYPNLADLVTSTGLASKSGAAFSGAVQSLALQSHQSINDILSAYALTAGFANNMVGYQQQINGILAAGVTLASGVEAKIGSIRGSAGGNDFPAGGLSWVGEKGKELVALPAGSRVIPHGESLNLAQRSGNSNGNNVTIYQNLTINGGDPAQVQAIIHQEFRSLELSLRAQ